LLDELKRCAIHDMDEQPPAKLNLEPTTGRAFHLPGGDVSLLPFVSKMNRFAIEARLLANGLHVTVHFNTDLVDPPEVRAAAEAYLRLLERAAHRPDQRLSTLLA
jgi:hypothetical protein